VDLLGPCTERSQRIFLQGHSGLCDEAATDGFRHESANDGYCESGWEEGGYAIEGQAQVARVKLGPIQVRPIDVRIHGE
jgi:hypothetical protein